MRIERRIAASVAILGSLLLALSGAAPALAGSGPSAGSARLTGLRLTALTNSSSTGFAGWVFKAKAAKSVTAEFKVPKPKCTAASAAIGPLSITLTGSTAAPKTSAAGVLLGCSGGSRVAAATVIVNNSETNDGINTVHAGDLMKATVTISASKTTATVQDLTKGHTFKFTQSGAGGTTFQEGIIDKAVSAGVKQLPVANFGTITYTNGAIGGKAIGSVKPQAAVNMQTNKKVLQIMTGKITGAKKNSFTTTFKHA